MLFVFAQIPLLAVAALGGYCVFELVWGVLSMGDADEAYVELQKVHGNKLMTCIVPRAFY